MTNATQTLEYWALMKARNPRQYAAHCPLHTRELVEKFEQQQAAAQPKPARKGTRGAMTTAEKSAYIDRHGAERFLSLPPK